MTGLGGDLRFALRGLRRNPGFTATALVVFALGIGANTAIFSVVDALVLRPLPFPGADRLVTVRAHNLGRGTLGSISAPDHQDLRAQVGAFSDVAVYRQRGLVLTGQGEAQMVPAVIASANLFDVLGVAPALGRTFAAGEDDPQGPALAVVSHGFWQAKLGGDPAALGQTVLLDGEPVRIIGVAPAWFRFPLDGPPVGLWMPLHGPLDAEARKWRSMHPYRAAIARLRPGAELGAARVELQSLSERLGRDHPKDKAGYSFVAAGLADDFTGGARQSLLLLLAAVGLVLLIACANLANLQLARAAARRREVAIRLALGAGRGRIVRQLLTESLLLALLGGALGVALAAAALELVAVAIPEEIARPHAITLDGRVLLFTALAAIAAGVLSGLAPALVAARAPGRAGEADRGHSAQRGRLRALLLAGEVALAVVLVIGAGLLLRSFARVLAVDPGFDPHGLIAARIKTSARVTSHPTLHQELLASVRALPGVQAATVAAPLPFSGFLDAGMHFTLNDRPPPPSDGAWLFKWHIVGADYFRTLGISLVQGRGFEAADGHPQARQVAIISESFARQYWPGWPRDGAGPLGRRVLAYNQFDWLIVGVAADVRGGACPPSGCAGDGHGSLERAGEPTLYSLMRRCCPPDLHVAARVSNPAGTGVGPALRAAVRQLDPGLAVQELRPMAELIDGSLSRRRLGLALLGLFAALALALALVGIHGVLAYDVAQRTREIAIRMALGARVRQVLQRVAAQGLAAAAVGLALGLLAALALGRLIESQLYGISPTDPLTFGALALLVLAAAAAATVLPARQAARIDPMIALRSD